MPEMSLAYSVAIPTMNRLTELHECLRHIFKQNPKPEKIIIIDDGELDLHELQGWLGEDKGRLLYFKKEAPGLIGSLNEAIQLCESEWLLILDDDIYLEDGFLEKLSGAILENPEVDNIAGGTGLSVLSVGQKDGARRGGRLFLEKIFLLSGGIEGRFLPSGFCTDYMCGTMPDAPYFVEHIPGGLGLWRCGILKQYGFNKWYEGYAYGNDKEVSYKISRRYKLLCCPDAKAIHRKSRQSRLSRRKLGEMRIRNNFYFYKNIFQKSNMTTLFFAWAIFGMFFLDAVGMVFSRNFIDRFHEISGMFSGLMKEFKLR